MRSWAAPVVLSLIDNLARLPLIGITNGSRSKLIVTFSPEWLVSIE